MTHEDFTEDQIVVLECSKVTCMEKSKQALWNRKAATVLPIADYTGQ